MKISAIISFIAMALAIPSGGSTSPNQGAVDTTTSGGGGKTVATLDPSVSNAVFIGNKNCRYPDYTISGCGVNSVTLQQGVMFCFSGNSYVLYCNNPTYPDDIYCSLSAAGDVRTVPYTTYCSATPPYYGGLTTSF